MKKITSRVRRIDGWQGTRARGMMQANLKPSVMSVKNGIESSDKCTGDED